MRRNDRTRSACLVANRVESHKQAHTLRKLEGNNFPLIQPLGRAQCNLSYGISAFLTNRAKPAETVMKLESLRWGLMYPRLVSNS